MTIFLTSNWLRGLERRLPSVSRWLRHADLFNPSNFRLNGVVDHLSRDQALLHALRDEHVVAVGVLRDLCDRVLLVVEITRLHYVM